MRQKFASSNFILKSWPISISKREVQWKRELLQQEFDKLGGHTEVGICPTWWAFFGTEIVGADSRVLCKDQGRVAVVSASQPGLAQMPLPPLTSLTHLDFRLQVCRAEKKSLAVSASHFVSLCYGSPGKHIHPGLYFWVSSHRNSWASPVRGDNQDFRNALPHFSLFYTPNYILSILLPSSLTEFSFCFLIHPLSPLSSSVWESCGC